MTYNMLGLFSFGKINDDKFDINFEIPDNCFYNFSESGGEYTIAIKLNPGESSPSTTFVPCNEAADILNKAFIATFEQHEGAGVVNKKPKIDFDL